MNISEVMTQSVKSSRGRERHLRSAFRTAKRLTTELPWQQRAAWLALSALVDVFGAVSTRAHRLERLSAGESTRRQGS